MGLSKRKLAALVKRKLDGGIGMSSKYDERTIFLYIDATIATMIGQAYRESGEEQYISSDWVKSFFVKTKMDYVRGEAFFLLPATLISLYGDAGLRQVSFRKGQKTPLIIQRNGDASIFSNLEANDVGDNYVCYLEENKVYIPEFKEPKVTMLVKMVCGTDGYQMNTPMSYPSTMEAEIIDRTYKLALYGGVEKYVNDSNSDSR